MAKISKIYHKLRQKINKILYLHFLLLKCVASCIMSLSVAILITPQKTSYEWQDKKCDATLKKSYYTIVITRLSLLNPLHSRSFCQMHILCWACQGKWNLWNFFSWLFHNSMVFNCRLHSKTQNLLAVGHQQGINWTGCMALLWHLEFKKVCCKKGMK